jgi:hypothetical protein
MIMGAPGRLNAAGSASLRGLRKLPRTPGTPAASATAQGNPVCAD